MAISGNYTTRLGESLAREGWEVEVVPPVSHGRSLHDIIYFDGLSVAFTTLGENGVDVNLFDSFLWDIGQFYGLLNLRKYCQDKAVNFNLDESSREQFRKSLFSLTADKNPLRSELAWKALFAF